MIRRAARGACTLLFSTLALVTAADEAAVAVVESLHEALLTVMRDPELDTAGRTEVLRDTVATTFDAPRITRLVLGAQWRRIDADDRERLERAQFELILTTYASRFDSWEGERFVTVGTAPAPPGQFLVRTRLELPDAPPVRLDYVLHEVGGDHRIFNVLADGFSETAVRRSEYGAILGRGGVDALLAEMERLIAANLQRGGGDG